MADDDFAIVTEDGDVLTDEYGDVLVWAAAPVPPVIPRRPYVESRLRVGQLELGPYTFGCQQTAVTLTPTHETVGSDTVTWCGRTVPASVRTRWTLTGTAVSDFADPAGFVRYAHGADNTTVPFRWTPNATTIPWVGTVKVRAVEIGGTVGRRLTVGWTWPLEGAPARYVDPGPSV